MGMDEKIDYIIGEEIDLHRLLKASEVVRLLDGAVQAGACRAEVADRDGNVLAGRGVESPYGVRRTILLEGEPSGMVSIYAPDAAAQIDGVADMLHIALQALIEGALKRMLTSEAHTTIVNQSYDELLAANKLLGASEQKYRELAASLELKVQERTLELSRAYAAMLQKEKLASIGGLAAGMAHEINNPIGFIISNLNTLTKYAAKLKEMLEFYRQTCEPVISEGLAQKAESLRKALKLDFVVTDLDDLVNQSLSGAERVQKLVADMKGFSHVDEAGPVPTDINKELEQTLRVLQHEVKEGTSIDCQLGDLPRVRLNPALLSQAFLQVIQNALRLETADLKLLISTCLQDDHVLIQIADNGPGIPLEIRDRIFEPFFTTKEVGKGVGMGLALAHQAVSACGGIITVECPPAGGTVFCISLPMGGTQQ
jgi:hypothetical protein